MPGKGKWPAEKQELNGYVSNRGTQQLVVRWFPFKPKGKGFQLHTKTSYPELQKPPLGLQPEVKLPCPVQKMFGKPSVVTQRISKE